MAVHFGVHILNLYKIKDFIFRLDDPNSTSEFSDLENILMNFFPLMYFTSK